MTGRLIVISNRIPTEEEPAGGLVFALHEALRARGGIWVGTHPHTSEIISDGFEKVGPDTGYERLAFRISDNEYRNYYLGFSNSVLWPVCHGRGDLVELRREFEAGYASVNSRLAHQLAKILQPDDIIWVHDYHFIPLAEELRALGVRNRIGFFLHIPFPGLGNASALPDSFDLPQKLTCYDLVGLQTRADVAKCLETFRADTRAELMLDGIIKLNANCVAVRSFPIGIDVNDFRKTAAEPDLSDDIDTSYPRELIIGVDRLDYSKGLPNRFRAFASFLSDRPHHMERVSFLQVAPPTREEVLAYRDIRVELEELAGRVNGEHAELDWTPLRYIHRSVPRKLLAQLYRRATVGLVTPLADGMNLVAKEFVAAQDPEDPGVLILSRTAGAAEDMTEALLVNPYDVQDISDAIREALEMTKIERIRRYRACISVVENTAIDIWSGNYLAALIRTKGQLYDFRSRQGFKLQSGFSEQPNLVVEGT
tara:strand:- start:6482 stop:7927 length:1446 start_codon:yes stop_codon:yes gene_type:complete